MEEYETKARVLLRYVGQRPYRLDAADEPVLPGDEIDENHSYAAIAAELANRADFVEVDDG